ncbi:MAG: septum formation initiator family protein [Bacteroidota bacterium]
MKINFQKIKSFFSRFNNRYLIAGIVFLVWVGFMDKNNLISQYGLISELKGLRKELNFYKSEIIRDNMQIRKLQTDPSYLEKFARETYLMKRENEDIFLMTDSIAPNVKK